VAKAEENLLQYSQEFDNARWTKTNTTITANATIAPDGTSTAEVVTDDATNDLHRVTHASLAVFLLNTPFTFSVFVKAGTHNFVQLLMTRSDLSNRYLSVVFDLSTSSATQTNSVNASDTASSIVSVGNGWYRCSITATATLSTFNSCAVNFASAASGNTLSANGWILYAGTGTTFEVWGAQLEQRSSVTAYTATTTAPITNYIPALQTAASGVARFEHNPVTGESLGLEIEEQRTNLVTYSDDLANAAWTKTASSISSNAIVAPDGTLTGDKLVEDSANAAHFVNPTAPSVTSGTAYTISIHAKAGERSVLQIVPSAGAFPVAFINFDLSAGTVGTFSGITSSSITSVGNGWYRCSVTLSATSTGSSGAIFVVQTSSSALRAGSYAGNGYSGIYIWGAQLEAGSFATSYIPTVASQVTRSSDAATMTGSNFTSWYRADAHTAYSEYTVLKAPDAAFNSNVAFGYGNGTGDEYVHLDTVNGATQIRGLVRAKATTYSAAQGTITAGTTIKAAIALSAGNGAFSANGATATAVNPVVMPLPTFANIGKNTAFSVFLNGNIKKVAFYPARLTNAEIQGLTTV
jgi:hypothetical protein